MLDAVPITGGIVSAYRIPTERPEADGTFSWDSTTLVLVELEAGDKRGLGYTYADRATAVLIHDLLLPKLTGQDALGIPRLWATMVQAIRNLGRPGIASMAISAVDVALWDLKAKLLGVSLVALLGQAQSGVPVYGSGGFTSYSEDDVSRQLGGWVEQGIARVKMKIGMGIKEDLRRVKATRGAIGPEAELFVDANGAYQPLQALQLAQELAEQGVTWFEEPVSSDNLEGLRLMRERGPAGLEVAAGEYGYDLPYFRRMAAAGAVDVLQADATRCAGITGFLAVAALCQAFGLPLSSHCAPALHLPACCAVPQVRHLEFFFDHVRIEELLFEGTQRPQGGVLKPDTTRPGLGLQWRAADAARFELNL